MLEELAKRAADVVGGSGGEDDVGESGGAGGHAALIEEGKYGGVGGFEEAMGITPGGGLLLDLAGRVSEVAVVLLLV
jgi:hypothetical protein